MDFVEVIPGKIVRATEIVDAELLPENAIGIHFANGEGFATKYDSSDDQERWWAYLSHQMTGIERVEVNTLHGSYWRTGG